MLASGLEFRVLVVRLRLRLGLGVILGLRLGGGGHQNTPLKSQSE